ncbi:MAG TPA: hypothetical protein VE155_15120 [Pseudonocardiaceae bacterium]|jgi:hypothetical protein|nr:hypothetical protein [Pseudonocardiaceae bacterium]
MTMAATEDETRMPLWQREATPASEITPEMLPLATVCEMTGLRAPTVQAAVWSTATTGPNSRLRELARPAWNYQGVPYWSAKQVADYFEQIGRTWEVRKQYKDLPVIHDVKTAAASQLCSLRGLCRVTGSTGGMEVPLTTFHRWKSDARFPGPAALMEVGSPTPRKLYHWPTVRAYIQEHRGEWIRTHEGTDLSGEVTEDTV